MTFTDVIHYKREVTKLNMRQAAEIGVVDVCAGIGQAGFQMYH